MLIFFNRKLTFVSINLLVSCGLFIQLPPTNIPQLVVPLVVAIMRFGGIMTVDDQITLDVLKGFLCCEAKPFRRTLVTATRCAIAYFGAKEFYPIIKGAVERFAEDHARESKLDHGLARNDKLFNDGIISAEQRRQNAQNYITQDINSKSSSDFEFTDKKTKIKRRNSI